MQRFFIHIVYQASAPTFSSDRAAIERALANAGTLDCADYDPDDGMRDLIFSFRYLSDARRAAQDTAPWNQHGNGDVWVGPTWEDSDEIIEEVAL